MNHATRLTLPAVILGLGLCVPEPAAAASPDHPEPAADSVLATLALPTDFQQTAALYALLSKADVEDVQRYLAQAQTITNINDRQAGTQIIYGRYLDLDPGGAVDHVINAGPTVNAGLFHSLFYSWSKIDLDAAIEKSQQLASPQMREVARQAILRAHADMGGQDLASLSDRLGEGGDNALLRLSFENTARMAEKDPRAAIAEAMKSGTPEQQIQLLQIIAATWAATDPDAALAYSEKLPALQRAPFREQVIVPLAQRDHDRALGMLESGQVAPTEQNVLLINALMPLIQTRGEHAFEHTMTLDDAEQRERMLKMVFSQLGQHDPETAIRLMGRMGEPSLWMPYVGYVLESYATKDPDAAFAWAGSLPANASQHQASVVSTVAKQDLDKALELVARMPASNERMQALSHVIEQSAQDNPQLAVEFLDLMPLGHLHQSTSRSIAETWLKQDPGAAMDWILNLPAQTQANLLQMLSWSVVQQDPELAMSLLPEIHASSVRQQWASAIAQRLGQSDPERAERWVRSLEDEPYSGELLTSVAVSLAQRDVPAAMELATDIGDTDQRNSAVIQIVDQWVTQDVEAAAAYVRSQQDADLQMNLVGAVLRQWNTFDPVAARKWVMAFDDPLVRDQGLASTILSPYTSEAEAAATLALISSDELRYSAISNYVHNLARYDTTSARAFLSRYSLPDEQMAPLLDYIDSIEQGF